MGNEFVSLLWPLGREVYEEKIKILSEDTINDLKLDELIRSITKDPNEFVFFKNTLTNICCDEQVIEYRQEVYRDLKNSEGLRIFFIEYIKRLDYLKYISKKTPVFEDIAIWKLITMLKELETYTNCVLDLKEALEQVELKSKGLLKLKKIVKEIALNSEFESLKKDINILQGDFNQIKSITVGINLDTFLNPEEATILSVNTTRFKENFSLSGFTDGKKEKDIIKDGRLHIKTHTLNTLNSGSFITRLINPFVKSDAENAIVDNAKREVEDFLKPVVRDFMSLLNNYINSRGYFLVELIPEFIYYLKWIEFFKKLETAMPLCFPRILKVNNRKTEIKDIYNLHLALHQLNKGEHPSTNIVLNNIGFNEKGRVLILTGPNMGGKTVITEAVGLVQLLFQAGLPVTAFSAEISPIDCIYTHFPVEETRTEDLGRLGEECRRLSYILREASEYSLILLNESLASTSFTEGMYIAEEVLRFMRYKGIRALYNTHMHELAEGVEKLNKETKGESLIISLITGMHDGKRSFKILEAAPTLKSYAIDISKKYGISLEQITAAIDQRRGK